MFKNIQDKSGWAYLLVAFTIVVASTYIKYSEISAKPLWSDELFSAGLIQYHSMGDLDFERKFVTQISPGDSFYTAKAAEQHPPLFELIGKGFSWISQPELRVRLQSLIASTLALLVVAIYFFRHKDERYLGIIFLFFLAFAGKYVEYAQEGRNYSLGMMFSVFIALFIHQGKSALPKTSWVEILVITGLWYTNYYAAIVGGVYWLIKVYYCRRSPKELARLALVPVSYLPWFFLTAHSILATSQGAVAWAKQQNLFLISIFPEEIFPFYFLALAFTAVVLYLVVGRFKDIRAKQLFLLYIISITLSFFVSYKSGIAHYRHLLFTSVILLFIICFSFSELVNKNKFFILPVLLAAFLFFDNFDHRKPRMEEYKKASEWIIKNADSTSQIVTTWQANTSYYRLYLQHFSGEDIIERIHPLNPNTNEEAICELAKSNSNTMLFAHSHHQSYIDSLFSKCPGLHLTQETLFPWIKVGVLSYSPENS